MFSKFFYQNVNILCHHCLFATFVAVINAEFLNIFVYIQRRLFGESDPVKNRFYYTES